MAEPLPATTSPGALCARTVPLDSGPVFDPVTLAGERGILFSGSSGSLVGLGEAARLRLPHGLADESRLADVTGWLRAIRHEDPGALAGRPGARVAAFAAVPFDPAAPAELVVPEILYAVDPDGSCLATVVAAHDDVVTADPAALAARLSAAHTVVTRTPQEVERREVPPGARYADAVRAALRMMEDDELSKVVLARSVNLRFDGPVPVAPALRRLREAEPTCTLFAFPAGEARFVGASPELLVRRRGPTVTAHPLAGTVALEPDDPAAEQRRVEGFLASEKERFEHRVVVEAIVEVLRPLCRQVERSDEPELVRLRTVGHLGTKITGQLTGYPDAPGALELVGRLHPTPAVGGVPTAAALAAMAELEAMDRGYWAGPVGWVDAAGDGDWLIGIRSATADGRTVTCLAGAGIVAGSDPGAELAETTVKLAPVLEAFTQASGARLAPTG